MLAEAYAPGVAHRGKGDFGFFQWTAVGFMLAFGVVAILSIGAPFFLLGLVLLGVMLGRGPRWPAGLGALAGAGGVGIVIGLIGAVAAPGMWAASGISLVMVSAVVFWWLRCRPTV
jgi:hypothetical protein